MRASVKATDASVAEGSIVDFERRNSSTTIIVGRSRDGEVISEFKSGGGKTVRVLDREVYRRASASASRKLIEIAGKGRR